MSTGCPVLSSNIINKCPTNITSHKSQVWAARRAWWCRVLPVRRPPSHWRGDTRPVAAPAAPPACSAPTCPAGLSPTVWVFKLLVKSDTSDQPRAVHPGSEYRNDKAWNTSNCRVCLNGDAQGWDLGLALHPHNLYRRRSHVTRSCLQTVHWIQNVIPDCMVRTPGDTGVLI